MIASFWPWNIVMTLSGQTTVGFAVDMTPDVSEEELCSFTLFKSELLPCRLSVEENPVTGHVSVCIR